MVRRVLLIVCLGAFLAINALPQVNVEDVDSTALRLSDAQIGIAGPSALYLRGVGHHDSLYSVVFRMDEDGTWRATTVYDEHADVFPADTVLDFATLLWLDPERGRFRLDGIFIAGVPYAAEFEIVLDGSIREVTGFVPSDWTGVNRRRVTEILGPIAQEIATETHRISPEEVTESLRELERLNDALEREIAELRRENERAVVEIAELLAEIDRLSAEPAPAVPSDDRDAAALRDALYDEVVALRSEIAEYGLSIARLERSLDGLRDEAAAYAESLRDDLVADEPLPGLDAEPSALADLLAEVAAFREMNEELRREQARIRTRLIAELRRSGYIALIKPELTKTVQAGFSGGASQIGPWRTETDRLVQPDPAQYFAKYIVPVEQTESTLLYSYEARAVGDGWVGNGLHFMVTDVRARGYGMGNSILVWLTRDPAAHGNDKTYLQLYKSDDDVTMGRVADAMIVDDIADFLRVEVLYEPVTEYVTVAINGEDKIRYKTWFGITEGVEVSLRALGAAEFRAFTIRAQP